MAFCSFFPFLYDSLHNLILRCGNVIVRLSETAGRCKSIVKKYIFNTTLRITGQNRGETGMKCEAELARGVRR